MRQTVRYSKIMLGLDPETEHPEVSVRAAFAHAVKADHPDLGGTGRLVGALQEARDVLLQAIETPRGACGNCAGSGSVRVRWGAVRCGACSGTGETR